MREILQQVTMRFRKLRTNFQNQYFTKLEIQKQMDGFLDLYNTGKLSQG